MDLKRRSLRWLTGAVFVTFWLPTSLSAEGLENCADISSAGGTKSSISSAVNLESFIKPIEQKQARENAEESRSANLRNSTTETLNSLFTPNKGVAVPDEPANEVQQHELDNNIACVSMSCSFGPDGNAQDVYAIFSDGSRLSLGDHSIHLAPTLIDAIQRTSVGEDSAELIASDETERVFAEGTQIQAAVHRDDEDGQLYFGKIETFAREEEDSEKLSAVSVDYRENNLKQAETDFEEDDLERISLSVDPETQRTRVSVINPPVEGSAPSDEDLLAGLDQLGQTDEAPTETVESTQEPSTETFEFDDFFATEETSVVPAPFVEEVFEEINESSLYTQLARQLDSGLSQVRNQINGLSRFLNDKPIDIRPLTPRIPQSPNAGSAFSFLNIFDQDNAPRTPSAQNQEAEDSSKEDLRDPNERFAKAGQLSRKRSGARRAISGGGGSGLPALESTLPLNPTSRIASEATPSPKAFRAVNEPTQNGLSPEAFDSSINSIAAIRALANQERFALDQENPALSSADLDKVLPVPPAAELVETAAAAFEDAYTEFRSTLPEPTSLAVDPFSMEALEDDQTPDRKKYLRDLMKRLASKHQFGQSRGARTIKSINLNREPQKESPGSANSNSSPLPESETPAFPWDLIAKAVETNRRPEDFLNLPG